ncbi:MAG: protein translocase SEC61 complex subunit gamma [archaeon]
MDANQGSTGTPKVDDSWIAAPEEEKTAEERKPPNIKMPVDISKFKFKLKMPEGGLSALIKSKFAEYKRVYSITKKPDKTEFTAIVKASGLGIIVIGVLGFIITMIVQLIQMYG